MGDSVGDAVGTAVGDEVGPTELKLGELEKERKLKTKNQQNKRRPGRKVTNSQFARLNV